MGVDLDGVLNPHRHHFCALLEKNVGKRLDPDRITVIPLHEDPGLGVSREDEKKVFNDPRYWTEMPCLSDARENLRKLRNMFKLKIHIFTHRQWPSEEIQGTSLYKQWRMHASDMISRSPLSESRLIRGLQRLQRPCYKAIVKDPIGPLAPNPMNVITKSWLLQNDIMYDELTIERGSEDISDPQGQFKNRFYISRKKKFRFFVEDDAEKARKLAYICDTVFLIWHPYNHKAEQPENVVRVQSWEDIFRWVRRLS